MTTGYRSRTTTQGRNMAGARSLWRATGMTDADFEKPIVAIANSFTQFVPGHVHLHEVGQRAKAVIDAGDAGAGQAAKICNNMILGISMIAVGEAFALAEKLGLSHQALFDVSSTSSGQCWALTSYCPVPGPVPASPANHGYKPGFASALMVKDLTLAQDAAKASGAATPLGKHAQEIYQAFDAAGNGGVDFSGVIQHVRGLAGK